MSKPDFSTAPKVLSEAEINAMLQGDKREVDRVLLTQTNSLAAAFLEFRYEEFPRHAKAEQDSMQAIRDITSELGDKEIARARMAYLDTMINRQKKRNEMMEKVATSAWAWALIAFLAFLAHSVWLRTTEAVEDARATHRERAK